MLIQLYNTDSKISCSHLLSIKFRHTRINAYGKPKMAFEMDMVFVLLQRVESFKHKISVTSQTTLMLLPL